MFFCVFLCVYIGLRKNEILFKFLILKKFFIDSTLGNIDLINFESLFLVFFLEYSL